MVTITETDALSTPAILLDDGPDDVSQVIVHPLVLLHVLDHHSRRAEVSGRVIGTLLGRRDGKKVRRDIISNVERGSGRRRQDAIGYDTMLTMAAAMLFV